MAANTTAAQGLVEEDVHLKRYRDFPMAASTKIFQGDIVAINASGEALNGADTASTVGVGIAVDTVDNSSGAAGDKRIRVAFGHTVHIASTSVTAADIGSAMVISDDSTVTNAATATNDIKIGSLKYIPSSNVAAVMVCVAASA